MNAKPPSPVRSTVESVIANRSGSIAWTKALLYERVEFVAAIHELLNMRVLRSDRVQVEEEEVFDASAGLTGVHQHVLCLRGTACISHEPLYIKIVRRIRLTMVSDLEMHIRFAAFPGDPLPEGLLLEALGPATPHFRAVRLWQRAYWAMRAGIVKKIADTRAIAQNRVNASAIGGHGAASSAAQRLKVLYRAGGTTSTDAPSPEPSTSSPMTSLAIPGKNCSTSGRRPLVPMSVYHQACASRVLDLSLLSRNAPTLVVFWASWDYDSTSWVQQTFFRGPPSDDEVASSSNGDDYWIDAISKIVAIGSPILVSPRQIASAVMTRAARGGEGPVAKVGATAVSVSPTKSSVQPAANQSTVVSPPATIGPGRSASLTKRANLVLVNLDNDVDAALSVSGDWMRRSKFWKSAEVSFSSVWAGAEGLQSHVATQLDIRNLPTVMAFTPSLIPGGQPLIASVCNPSAHATTLGSISATSALPKDTTSTEIPLTALRLRPWHDTPDAVRNEVHRVVDHVLASSDAPVVFSSRVAVLYPRHGEYQTESDLKALGERCSEVRLRGTCSSYVADALEPVVAVLQRVRAAELHLFVMAPSPAISLSFDPLRAEHRVKGLYWNITCEHCKKWIATNVEHHYHCLHCQVGMCGACYEGRMHAPHHICVKLPSNAHEICHVNLIGSTSPRREARLPLPPPLWGSSNVGMLPTVHGRVLPSITNTHHDTFCNACRTVITGDRWKCCMCHEFDLCSRCEALWWTSMDGSGAARRSAMSFTSKKKKTKIVSQEMSHTTTSAHTLGAHTLTHPPSHYMMHIRCAVPGDCSGFLCPRRTLRTFEGEATSNS